MSTPKNNFNRMHLAEMLAMRDALNAAIHHKRQACSDDHWNNYRGNELLKRVLMVAAVQQQPVVLVGCAAELDAALPLAERVKVSALAVVTPRRATNFEAFKDQMNRRAFEISEMFCEVPERTFRDLNNKLPGTQLDFIRTRLAKASRIALDASQPLEPSQLPSDCQVVLKQASEELWLSCRGIALAIKTARSIAALEGRENIQVVDLCEAIQYSPERLELVQR